MKRAALPLLLLLSSFLPAVPADAGEQTILRVHTWSEYFDVDVLAAFEERHDCVVAIDTFDSNETMLDDLVGGGARAYDIVTPSAYMAMEMRRRGLLQDIDGRLVPNLGNLDPEFAVLSGDPAMEFSVPYTRTVTGIGYNAARLGGLAKSWEVFSDAALAGRMIMLDDMREAMGAALKSLGYSLNTTDDGELEAAGRVLAGWKRNLAKFEVDEGNIGLGSGEYLAVQGYNGDIGLIMGENPDLDFFVPEEGSAVSIDCFVILANSSKRELGHAFINHMLDVDTAARNMGTILYYMPVPAAVAKLDRELLESHSFSVPPDVLAKCEVIHDLGVDTAKYEAVWEGVKRSAR